jgi:hypothetical protein
LELDKSLFDIDFGPPPPIKIAIWALVPFILVLP